MGFIKWIKNDFKRTKVALELLLNRNIQMWVFVLYYMAWLPIVLPFAPLAYLVEKRLIKNAEKYLKGEA